MDIYMAGAEQSIYMRQLERLDVTHVAISFYEWRRRHRDDTLYKHIPESVSVCITPGVSRKKDIDWAEFAKDYLEFCEHNADGTLIYDLDAVDCPVKIRKELRQAICQLPNTVIFPFEGEDIRNLTHEHERIGINARLAKSMPVPEMRRLQATLYGSNITNAVILQGGRFAATTSFTWLSAKKYGELWLFSRGKLVHYKAEDLAKGVRAHNRELQALGVDPLACLNNDSKSLVQVAVKSLQQLAESLSGRPRDRSKVRDTLPNAENAEPPRNEPEEAVTLTPHGGALVAISRDQVLLPVISMNEQLGVDSRAESLRQCDTCYLSNVCPKYEGGAACAFKMPVVFETDAQWESFAETILEIQGQRILFSTFAEQVEGGAIQPLVGQEMDRFFKMLQTLKEVKAPVVAPGSGAMARFLGAPELPPGGFNAEDAEEIDDEQEDYGDDEDDRPPKKRDADTRPARQEERPVASDRA